MTKEETISNLKAYLNGDTAIGNIIPLRHVLEYALEYLEPSLPSNLDEAAELSANDAMIKRQFPSVVYNTGLNCFNHSDLIKQFKAGAEWMAGQGVSLSHLIAWYIQSIDAHEPFWTKEHLEELVKDYILIPKN